MDAGTLSVVLIAEVLAFSAAYKLITRTESDRAAAAYTLLRWIPSKYLSLATIAFSLAELVTAVLLFNAPTRRSGLGLAIALLFLLTILVATDQRQILLHCGCWGATRLDIPKWAYLARNGLLTLIALLSYAASPDLSSADWIETLIASALVLPLALILLELPGILHVASVARVQRHGAGGT